MVASGGHRAILLGDAVTYPVQLDEPTWHSIGDVDPDLANRTREHLARTRRREHQRRRRHLPELKFGSVLEGKGRRWWT